MINSTVHNGYGWGINIETSWNIKIQNTTVFAFRPMGFAVTTSKNVSIDGNIVSGVVERTTLDVDGTKLVDYGGGFSICALSTSGPCEGITLTNNIAAGVVYAGFVTHGNDCGDTSGR